jgi:hypothetical protein
MSVEHYVVCRMVIGSPPRVPADEEEYKACSSAVDGIQRVCDVEEKYENVIENYVEWESAIRARTHKSSSMSGSPRHRPPLCNRSKCRDVP